MELTRIALGLEYKGTAFCGWQRQAQGYSVQDALEDALLQVAGQTVEVVPAGRTDAGVHASAQVVHFETRVARPLTAWVRGVNSFLPASVAVLWSRRVDAAFHARFSARSRSYRYLLLNRPVRPALNSERCGWYHGKLDIERMRQAASLLLGEHDFSAFRAAECQARSPVRLMRHLEVRRQGEYIVFDLTANAFLHHMVRNIVGTLLWVGRDKRPVEWMEELLRSRDRTQAGPTAAAAGLHLRHVEYDPSWGLPLPVDPRYDIGQLD